MEDTPVSRKLRAQSRKIIIAGQYDRLDRLQISLLAEIRHELRVTGHLRDISATEGFMEDVDRALMLDSASQSTYS